MLCRYDHFDRTTIIWFWPIWWSILLWLLVMPRKLCSFFLHRLSILLWRLFKLKTKTNGLLIHLHSTAIWLSKYKRWENKWLWPGLSGSIFLGLPENSDKWSALVRVRRRTNKQRDLTQKWPNLGAISVPEFCQMVWAGGAAKRAKEHLKCFRPDMFERRLGP